MIVDGFTFFNELDVLMIRLEELYPVVDQFVIVEADMTFRGDKKRSFFSDHMEFFTKYFDKITLRQVINPGNVVGRDGEIPWIRERAQRNGIGYAFKDLKPDDLVIISDVDEIPRRETIEQADIKELTSLNMHMYYYGLNIYDCEWDAAKILPYRDFTTAEEVRQANANRFYDNAGWHFSYLGTPETVRQKLKSFSHWELDTPEITNLQNITDRMNRGEDVWGHGKKYQRVEVDDTYPHAVRRRPEYFKKYIW